MADSDPEIEEFKQSLRFRHEDRASNPVGATGFALGVTVLLFMCSGFAASKELPFYLGLTTCLGLPTALAGLVCSLIGCTRKGRPKLLALCGAALCGLLVLMVIPAALIQLKNGP